MLVKNFYIAHSADRAGIRASTRHVQVSVMTMIVRGDAIIALN